MKNLKSNIVLWIIAIIFLLIAVLSSGNPTRTDAYMGLINTVETNQIYEV